MFGIKFKKLENKSRLAINDLKNLSWEDLAENFLILYQDSTKLQKENEANLKKISQQQEIIWQKKKYSTQISDTFTCYFCLEKWEKKDLASILDNGNILLCGLCLKNGWEKADQIRPKTENSSEPSKEELEKELKEWEEMGLEKYLESYKEVYLNQVQDLKNKLKEK